MPPAQPTPWSRGIPRVAVLPWPGIEGAFLVLSGAKRAPTIEGERWRAGHAEHKNTYSNLDFRTEPLITFTFATDKMIAEWDGSYGPIQLWWKCDKADDGCEAREHWFFDYAHGGGHWSQMAVEESHLPQLFNTGDYASIFRVLQSWTNR